MAFPKPSCIYLVFIAQLVEGVQFSQQYLDEEVGPVVFVNVLYRHGDRNPLHLFPTDPFKDLKYWPEGYGQLTKAGKLHHYQLGRWLRKRYLHLIPNGRYHHDIIKVVSTDVDRTLMSAQVNLAGMFPPQKDEKWSQMVWQPIPIHTIPKNLDNLLWMGAPCLKYDRLNLAFKNSAEFKQIKDKYKDALEYCTEHAGVKCTMGAITDINSDLFIEKMRNMTLPEWLYKIYPTPAEEAAAIQFAVKTWTLEMKRLVGGPLVKRMTDSMTKKIHQTGSKQTMAVFSAHDSTIVNLLNTLGVYDFVAPPFYSLVLVELRHGSDNEYYVTVLYKNTTNPSGKPHLLKLPGCEEACPFTKMMELLSPVIPEDWESECEDPKVGENEIDRMREDGHDE